MKIAIIGTGISGLGAGYLLHKKHDITLYEKNNYLGGHSRTIEIDENGLQQAVDTGFIVFNNWNYPNLLGLFKELEVPYEKSDMSFGVDIANGWLSYSSGNVLTSIKNLVRPHYWKMLKDILKFNKRAPEYLERDVDVTLAQCLNELKMGKWFRRYYLQAMGAAIWSCSIDTIEDFPARTFVRFFKNHGLLNIKNRPQWYTVTGGSREYVKRLSAGFKDRIKTNCAVEKVVRSKDKVTIHDTKGDAAEFDQVIFACHPDQAMKLLENPTKEEQKIIGDFTYQPNSIVVHSDESFMPRDKTSWASWIYLSEGRADEKPVVSLSYWMNNLQNFETERPLLVTLNPERQPDETLVHDRHNFSHPVFNVAAIKAQEKIEELNGQNNTWFCGAYQRYGFHEDGLWSAVRVAKALGVEPRWS